MAPIGSASIAIPPPRHSTGTLIGYARVSTEEQQTDPQLDTLRAAGCQAIFEERASGGSRSRVELARCLERIGPGDTLVVVRIDRLARSLAHLLEVIERLRARGRISGASATRSTPPVRRASSPSRCWAPPPSWSGR